jgi:FlaA1/EpsC-like NDP-sugar epimerase
MYVDVMMFLDAWQCNNADVTADDGWSDFLGISGKQADLLQLAALNHGKSILLTGAGGSIGSALARAVLIAGPRRLVLLDNAEHGLYELQATLRQMHPKAKTSCVEIVGDICDRSFINEVFDQHRPQIVYHAAALKQVPLSECNPLAVVRSNAFGTYVLAKSAMRHHAEQMVLVSTDKAVNPHSLMGASKRLAELVILGLSSAELRMRAVRFGNVLGSRGSVVPLFQRQIAAGGPVTITHREVRRYFLTMRYAVELILLTASLGDSSGIFFPELGEQIRIVDLADYLIRKAGFSPEQIPVVFTRLRPGDKMHENLVSVRETAGGQIGNRLYPVKSPSVSMDEVDTFMTHLEDGLQRRDTAALLDLVCRLVPEYQPGKSFLEAFGAGCLENATG